MVELHLRCAITGTILTITCNETDTVKTVKEHLRDKHGMRMDLIVLKYRGSHLKDGMRLDSSVFDGTTLITLSFMPPPSVPLHLRSYECYIASVVFKSQEGHVCPGKQVPLKCSIHIELKPHGSKRLSIKDLIHGNREVDACSGLPHICGLSQAKSRGFVQWTNNVQSQQVMLIEVLDVDLEQRIDGIRYRWDGVNGFYSGGDPHSWQRYTKRLPLRIDMGAVENRIEIFPRDELTPGSQYAILIMHGVRTEDATSDDNIHVNNKMNEVDDDSHHSDSLNVGVVEDALFFFRTSHMNSILSVESENDSGSQTAPDIPTKPVEMRVQLYCSSKTYISRMTVNEQTTVGDLKGQVRELCGVADRDMILAINGEISVDDDDPLCGYFIKLTNNVQVLPTFAPQISPSFCDYSQETSALDSSYRPYIRTTFPSYNQTGVSPSVTISIQFQAVEHISRFATRISRRPNSLSRRLVLDCFRDAFTPFPGCTHGMVSQDMVEALGAVEAAKRGHITWVKSPQKVLRWTRQRLFILELAAGLNEKSLERVRYSAAPWKGKNGSYRGGDRHSWQRYTKRLPVSGTIQVDKSTQRVFFKPTSSLKHGTRYAVLLQHGIPSVPHQTGPDISEVGCDDWYAIQEDYLFTFVTSGENSVHNADKGVSSQEYREGNSCSDRSSAADCNVS
mmetsp:Transcript_20937/g.30179  ORF Transcript_20937/g.30179 Transcript_20937/m.30179 type:complete len:676 (+) Transcript_20937:123-2150(+)